MLVFQFYHFSKQFLSKLSKTKYLAFCKSCKNDYSDKQHCLQKIRKYIWIPFKKCFQVNLFLAQQWRITPEGKLENRLRTWAYGKKNATQIPSYGEQGIINITKKYGQNTILTIPFPGKGKTMIYKSKYNHKKSQPFQLWKIGLPDELGWFNITSSKAEKKYLTVTKIGNLMELTMEEEGL